MHRKPAAPGTLTATRLSATSAALAWVDTSTFETGVQIQRRESGGSWFTVVALQVADTPSYVDATMTAGVGYDFRVRAQTLTTFSPYSNIATVTATVPVPIPLAPPTGVTATAGDASVTTAWSSVTGATGYKLKRSTTNGGPYTLVATVAGVTCADSGLTNGVRQYYVVAATGSTGDSVNSAQVSATPQATITPPATISAPTGVTATPGDTKATISWSAPSGATNYTLLRGTAAGVHGTVVATGITATTYQATGLSNGTTYFFVVKALNATLTSADSAEVSATPAATTSIPSAPTGVMCTAGNAANDLAWSASTGATSYTLQRSTTSGSGYVTIATGVTALSYTNSGLTNGTTYYYIVKAVNSAGTSVASSQVSGAPAAPGNGTTHSPTTAGQLTTLLGGGSLNGNTLHAGDTIQLQDGTTYSGSFHLSITGTAQNPITLTRSGSLPSVMNAMSSSSRATFLSAMSTAPVISTSTVDAALLIEGNVDYWNISGIKFLINISGQGLGSSVAIKGGFLADSNSNVSTAAALPDHISFDRLWVTGTATGDCSYGFYMNGTNTTIKNCLIDEIHGVGQETKGILVTQGLGPYTITNNYIKAAGIGILFGGEDPTINLAIPSDLSITGNYITKDPTWDPFAANHGHVYAGIHWGVKNGVEFKNAQRVVFSGNLVEYSWRDGQNGYLILVTPQNQSGGAPWVGVQHILIENNICRHGNAGMQITGSDADGDVSLRVVDLVIHNNLWYDISGARFGSDESPDGRMMIVGHAPTDLTYTHNTCDNTGATWIGLSSYLGGTSYETLEQVNFSNNFGKATDYFIFGDGGPQGQNALDAYVTGIRTCLNNVIGSNGTLSSVPATNDTPTVTAWDATFPGKATGDYTVTVGSPYKSGGAKDASDGTDVGVNMALLPVVS